VPVAAGIVGHAGLTAILAALDMAAERRCPAHLDRRHDAALSGSQAAGPIGAIGGTMAAEDIRHLVTRPTPQPSSKQSSNLDIFMEFRWTVFWNTRRLFIAETAYYLNLPDLN
jgi:hypothetical protein